MVIDGKKIAQEITEGLIQRVKALPFVPVFADVLVGDDSVSKSFVRIKQREAEKLGIEFREVNMPEASTTAEVVERIRSVCAKPHMAGVIVQLPMPAHIDRLAVLDAIIPELDVDCIGSHQARKFYNGELVPPPPTASAIMHILRSLPVALAEKEFLVIGQGDLVGKPVSFLLGREGFSVRTANRSTGDMQQLLSQADVIISGAGQPGLIHGEMIKPGSILIDAGTSESDGSIVGDVDFDSCASLASYISPVPGGVGPVTVAKLLENVVSVAETKIVKY